MSRTRHHDDITIGLVKGALAGAVATWVMGQVTGYLYERENEQARQREDEARQGKTAFGVAAEKAAGAVAQDLSQEQRQQYGSALHWGLGIGAGSVYGALRGRFPGADAGMGLLYGSTFWALIDEGANVALGLTPGPSSFPWQTHARGLAGHLAFGLTADTTLRVLDRMV